MKHEFFTLNDIFLVFFVTNKRALRDAAAPESSGSSEGSLVTSNWVSTLNFLPWRAPISNIKYQISNIKCQPTSPASSLRSLPQKSEPGQAIRPYRERACVCARARFFSFSLSPCPPKSSLLTSVAFVLLQKSSSSGPAIRCNRLISPLAS